MFLTTPYIDQAITRFDPLHRFIPRTPAGVAFSPRVIVPPSLALTRFLLAPRLELLHPFFTHAYEVPD